MKVFTKIFSLILVAIMAIQAPLTVYATTKLKSNYTGSTYSHQARFDDAQKINGIDVSEHNGTIDWKKVKADGIEYAFIRVGYTGYRKDKFSTNYDANYKKNLENAIDAGIKVGVYWYSQAITTSEAKAEAKKLVSVLSSYKISMPVVMDYEFAGTSSGRLDSSKLSKSKMTSIALTFLNEVENAGYDGCLYANMSFLENHLDASKISDNYTIWLAHYTTNTSYDGEFNYWQYSSKGKVDGIKGYTDVNIYYYFSDAVSLADKVYTGSAIKPLPTIKHDGNTLKKDKDYKLSYKNNVNIGTASITATGINDYAGYIWHYKFDITPDKVKAITIKERTNNSLTFYWTPVKGVKTYYLYIKDTKTGKGFVKTVTGTTLKITGLKAGTQYTAKVRGYKVGTQGNIVFGKYSGENNKYTLNNKVTNLRVTSRTLSAVKLSWNKVSTADGYRIYRYIPSTNKYFVIADIDGKDNTSYIVRGLTVGALYRYQVAAYNYENTSRKIGYRSDMLTDTPRPNMVTVTQAVSPYGDSFRLRWYRVKGTGYQLQWSTSKDFSSNVKSTTIIGWNAYRKTIKTCTSGKYYYVRIRAFKQVEDDRRVYGNWSKTQRIKIK